MHSGFCQCERNHSPIPLSSVNNSSLKLAETMNSSKLSKVSKCILIGLLLLVHVSIATASSTDLEETLEKLNREGSQATEKELLKCLIDSECNLHHILGRERTPHTVQRHTGGEKLVAMLDQQEHPIRLPSQERMSYPHPIHHDKVNPSQETQSNSILSSILGLGGRVHHGRPNPVSFNKRVADERSKSGFFQEW